MGAAPAATLADLVAILDAELVEQPRGVTVPVGKVVVLDEADLAAGGAGLPSDAVVLMVGAPPAAIAGPARGALPEVTFAALVVRGDLTSAVHEFALTAGAAVLRIPQQTGWNEVLRRLRRVGPTAFARVSDRQSGPLDLFGVADAAASIAGGPVTVEDTLHRILAYSADQSGGDQLRIQTLLHRRTPTGVLDRLRASGTLRRVLAAHEPTLLHDVAPDARPRLVVPMRSHDEVLGLLWAALPAGTDEVSADTTAAFARCAGRAATHLVQLDGVLGRVRRVEVEHLARLLHSGDESAYSGESRVLSDGVHWVIAAALDLSPDRRTHAKSRMVHILDRARLTGDVQLIVGELNDLVYVIAAAPKPDPTIPERIVALLDGVAGLSIGVSATANASEELPRARVQAERALSVARHASYPRSVAVFDDVWPTAVLLRLAASPLAAEIAGSGPLRRLQELDHLNGSEYLRTLREYLLAGADSREAAARLHVHVNTVRYRMAKLRDEVPLDIDDPLARLVITLQLTLLGLGSGGGRLG